MKSKQSRRSSKLKAEIDCLKQRQTRQSRAPQRESARRYAGPRAGRREKRIKRAIEEREQEKKTQKVEELYKRIEDQLAEAKVTDKDEMESVLIHGRRADFEIEELKRLLSG